MEKRIAVIFPGVGYHVDKPLLYYSRKLAGKNGYEIVCADYGTLPSGIKGDEKKMYAAYEQALANVTAGLSEVDFSSYDRVLFISKSIGTAVAASYDAGNQIGAGHVFYTPVAASFQAIGREGIVFHGTGDDWAETDVIAAECEKRGLPLYLTEQANHSMETGDVFRDLEILETIMKDRKNVLESSVHEVELLDNDRESLSYVIHPIIMNGDAIGLVIVISDQSNIGQAEEKLVSVVAQFLGKHIEE